jgi:hypothetical protein
VRSRDSSVSIATCYGLEGPGIESRWGEIFRTYPYWLRGPPNLLYNGYRVFPGGEGGRGVMLTTHPLIVPRLRKSWVLPPLTLWVLLGLLRGSLYPLYLSPCRCRFVFGRGHLCFRVSIHCGQYSNSGWRQWRMLVVFLKYVVHLKCLDKWQELVPTPKRGERFIWMYVNT